ncbi:ABC transporter ATP-binding protein [Prochlorococcus marinus]|uniref:ABC transporter ATP-binding protein n=1 Tax=Prochlorococcus marinus TaxID=1219 RepID=UPI0022B4540F|nr:ABC transporter ATP-binding protein [Prochlorococcus marinus]
MNNSSKEVLKINQLNAIYPNTTTYVLRGLNLNMNAGDRLALVGSSGCGKSTVAKAVMQLLPNGCICDGEIVLNGRNVLELGKVSLQNIRGKEVGLIFQDPMSRLNPLMTVGEHLVDTFKAHDDSEPIYKLKKKAKRLLEKVGIDPLRFNSFPHEFSGGMRQRIAIALAICLRPPLIIADEPTTSLDTIVSDQIMSELSLLCDEIGTALLLISHDLSMAYKWCNKIAILDFGHIVESGNIKEIVANPKTKIAQKLVNSASILEGSEREKINKNTALLNVNRLRCWHDLGFWPFKSSWLKAVNEVTFSLYEGETLGVVGPSGCGKSTLCRALTGLLPIRGGSVFFFGKDISTINRKSLKQLRKYIQIIFQDPSASLNPKMSVIDSIIDPILIHQLFSRSKAREKARNLLKLVGLTPTAIYEKRFPSQLSGGQQQRVVIARALALSPKILICDESVSMLDAEIQAEVLELLRSLQEKLKLSMLFITHDLSVAAGFCHRVLVFDKGTIIEENSGKNLLNHPQKYLTKKMVKACPRLPK